SGIGRAQGRRAAGGAQPQTFAHSRCGLPAWRRAMTHDPEHLNRLRFLLRVVQRERKQLQNTDRRVFDEPFTVARARQLDTDVELSERIEAFASRFSRLQDTVGDKLIPIVLRMLGESPGAAIDNFDRAERLGWLASADEWMSTRLLRNQMIHEYIEDPAILASALQAAHERVPMLVATTLALEAEVENRGWLVTATSTPPT
ncbi:MAG: hypothetical protein K8F35_14645, partial [Dokdonella sp.]|uniref:hypothetical protein n=2 Tax=Dokdonella sp. TaxID=2291710 RepID=UPI0025BDA676